MLAYKARERAFLDGETDYVSVRLGVRVTPTQIDLLMDGVVFSTYTGDYKTLFSQGMTIGETTYSASTGVGFTSVTAGTTFSNFSWTPYTAQS